MKKIATLIACILFSSYTFSQKIKVSESTEKIGGGSHNSLVVSIYEVEADEILKEWKSLMKHYDGKVTMSDGVFADNAIIKSMGPNSMDIYARTEKVKEGEVKLIVGFDLGGAYLSSSLHGEQFKIAKQIVYDFAVKTTKESVADQLKAAQKILNKITDQHEDLVKNTESLKKDIEDYKSRIKKAEENIVKNNSEQEKKKQEISSQQKVVDAIATKQKAID